MSDLLIQKSAVISPCGTWRYRLTRVWSAAPLLPFVMLNPSIADADIDDPTIRRCMSFAQREGAGGIVVINLFGLRSPDPSVLSSAANPWGPDNDEVVTEVLAEAVVRRTPVVAAWGANSIRQGEQRMLGRFRDFSVDGFCLGKTKHGHPKHPLYVRGDQPLVPFP
jgi:hypothetical protein